MKEVAVLPPGQRERDDFPRFGLDQFAERVPDVGPISLAVREPHGVGFSLDGADLQAVPKVSQVSDLHCVTTWSAMNLHWSGWRFRDVWTQCIAPRLAGETAWLVVRGADGFRARLPLADALSDDVMLADGLDGVPLCLLHGGPLRFVAPAHYAYKGPKYVVSIACLPDCDDFLPDTPVRFMEHPRARVALEERGQLPGWLLRRLYRPLVDRTVRRFRTAWDQRDG